MTTEYNQIDTGFFEDSVDIGTKYVTKSYLIDVYPYLTPGIISAPGLFVWGFNNYGQLGTNDRIDRSSPVQTVAGGTNWKQVTAKYYTSAAIKTDGTLWLCGYNGNGQLGTNNLTHKSSPVQTISGGTNWKTVSFGNAFVAAIKTDGTLWLWGDNQAGQLGTNNLTHRSSPVQTLTGGATWKMVSCGAHCTLTTKTDGTLWVWGVNNWGQLGINDVTGRSSPVQVYGGGTNWKTISAGKAHSSAIKDDGTLWLWGYNQYGQLGTNDLTNRSSPVQTVLGGTNWKIVSCGYFHTAAIKTDGTLWTWGYNTNGQLGTNNTVQGSSPIQVYGGGTNWKIISCGYLHTAAIKTDGTLWMWGTNSNGQLGNNEIVRKSSPVQTISSGTNWKAVSAGLYTAAIAEIGDDF